MFVFSVGQVGRRQGPMIVSHMFNAGRNPSQDGLLHTAVPFALAIFADADSRDGAKSTSARSEHLGWQQADERCTLLSSRDEAAAEC